MKTIKIFTMLLMVTTLATAQDISPSEVPAAVKAAFSKENLKGSDMEWEKEMDNYKIEFEVNRMDHEIWYDATGTVLKREQELMETDLPQAVKNAIKSRYAGYRVNDVEMTWEANATSYEIELEKGWTEKKVTFNENGDVISERRD